MPMQELLRRRRWCLTRSWSNPNVITQDMEETVSLDDEKPESVVVPEESDKKVEPQPEPETSQVDDLWADALNKGKVADSIAAKGEKKGSPQGSVESGALAGSPGYGDYDLGGAGVDRPSAQARVCRNER